MHLRHIKIIVNLRAIIIPKNQMKFEKMRTTEAV